MVTTSQSHCCFSLPLSLPKLKACVTPTQQKIEEVGFQRKQIGGYVTLSGSRLKILTMMMWQIRDVCGVRLENLESERWLMIRGRSWRWLMFELIQLPMKFPQWARLALKQFNWFRLYHCLLVIFGILRIFHFFSYDWISIDACLDFIVEPINSIRYVKHRINVVLLK